MSLDLVTNVLRSIYSTWNNPKPLQTAKLGVGFNSFNGQTMALAVDAQPPPPNGETQISSDFHLVEKVSKLERIFGIDLSVGYAACIVSLGDVLSLLDQVTLSMYDLFVIASMSVVLPSEALYGGNLTGQARLDAEQLDQNSFFAKYGDSFISRIDRGGRLYGVLHVSCQTSDQKSALVNSFNASALGASLAVRIRQMNDQMSQVNQVDSAFLKIGGKTSGVIDDLGTFLNLLDSFGEEVQQTRGSTISFGLSGYQLTNWPDGGKAPADFSKARRTMGTAFSYLNACQDYLDDLYSVIADPALFSFADVTLEQCKQEAAVVKQAAAQTAAQINATASSPLAAKAFAPPDDLSTVRLPVMKNVPVPSFSFWVGVFQVAQSYSTSGNWAGFLNGDSLDSFAIDRPGGLLDIHFSYSGQFHHGAFGPTTNESGGDGGRCAPQGPAWLIGIAISLGGKDAGLFNICYQLHYGNGKTSPVFRNGQWVATDDNNRFDGLRVFLERKSAQSFVRGAGTARQRT